MDGGNNPPKIAILGAGFSGLCAGIQLQKQLNLDAFTIFDENHDVGGTWLVNTYPGCACDIPSHLYSYSFEPNPYWSKAYSPQQEIWRYLQNVAKKYDLYSKIKFRHYITSVEWEESILKWKIKMLNAEDQEETHIFDIVISGVGALRVPNWPEQFEPFCKPKMHSAKWDSSIELKNKVVAIVGSGASAVQIIPEIVDKVKRLIVYQRKPTWVMPRVQMEFPSVVKWAFSHVPGVQWALRASLFWSYELTHSAFFKDSVMSKLAVKLATYHLNHQVSDPKLREKLLPSYQIGCKRITPSNDYYPALSKPNVTLITSPISEVTEDKIINKDGTTEKPDVLILATGFKVQDFFAPVVIKGKNGQDMLEKWKRDGPSAYVGITTYDMPNIFFMLGPNTGLGHNSIIFTIECQVNWMIEMIREMMNRNAQVVTVNKQVEDEYMDYIRMKTKPTVWGTEKCASWYTDDKGRNTTIWPENLVAYYNRLKNTDFSEFDFQ